MQDGEDVGFGDVGGDGRYFEGVGGGVEDLGIIR